ncbi:uncharacterized protein LOC110843261 [Folsomia candida]|uniref:Uncharacterized protein n=1 Tax=Folsomia candida TaxID=158441 RepID=A0A226EMX0_FOLCA|nr:uncharacterized protein LOC110843261 [Folsomia candida]OXA58982.1 hypothetical protein Fcan01_04888 [Folsomia candida]
MTVNVVSLVCWIALILVRLYFLDAAPAERNFNDWQETHTPWGRMLAMMSEFRGMQCQRGFYNLSYAVTDSVFHCANLKRPKKSRRHFGDELVDWEGESPMLCFKTCVMRESGAMNDDNTGIDKERTHHMFFEGMRKPGGHMTVDVMTEELLACDQKYPTIFPRYYRNCTNTENIFRCYGKVLNNCDRIGEMNFSDDVNENIKMDYE